MPKPNHDFLKSWGPIIVTAAIQVGMFLAKDARIQEDVKQLLAEVRDLKDFKSAYTVKVDHLLDKIRSVK